MCRASKGSFPRCTSFKRSGTHHLSTGKKLTVLHTKAAKNYFCQKSFEKTFSILCYRINFWLSFCFSTLILSKKNSPCSTSFWKHDSVSSSTHLCTVAEPLPSILLGLSLDTISYLVVGISSRSGDHIRHQDMGSG